MLKKVSLILLITIFLILPCYAELGTDFQAPSDFEKSDIWDTAVYDIYDLKTDENVQLFICDYTDDDYDLFFKNGEDYTVEDLDDNIIMGKDTFLNDGYALEIIEEGSDKYIVYMMLSDNPTDDQIKDSVEYLTEFNKLNNVEPIEV